MLFQSIAVSPAMTRTRRSRANFMVDVAHRSQEFLIEWGLPNLGVGVTPDDGELVTRHGGAVENEAIKKSLVRTVGKFDHDRIDDSREFRMPHKFQAEIRVILPGMTLTKTDDVSGAPRSEDLPDDRRVAILRRHRHR